MKTHSSIILFLLGLLFLMPGCSDDSVVLLPEDKNRALFDELNEIPTVSFFLNHKSVISRSGESHIYGFPAFSDSELDFLYSLSPEEMKEYLDNITNQIGEKNLELADEANIEAYMAVYDYIGPASMERLKKFGSDYLNSEKGWETISLLLPSNLSETETELYLIMAVCIDKSIRPIYNKILSRDETRIFVGPGSGDMNLELCRAQLSQKLLLLGGRITVDEFIDIMTGGTATPIELIMDGIDAVSIWLDYENCRGRWH